MKTTTLIPTVLALAVLILPTAASAMTLDDVTTQLDLYKQQVAADPSVLGASSTSATIPTAPILPANGAQTLMQALVYAKGGPNVVSGSLKANMTSDDVKALQIFLNTQGFNVPATGKYGIATQAAVKSFQLAHGITGTNGLYVGPQTNAAITAIVAAQTKQ